MVGQIYEEPKPQIIINSGGNEKEDWQSQLIKIGLIIGGIVLVGIGIVSLVVVFSILDFLTSFLDNFNFGGGFDVFSIPGMIFAPLSPIATGLLSIFVGGRN